MVESWIVSKLDTVSELSRQVYPTAAPVGDCEPPFAIYTVLSSVPTADMSGDVAYYTDTVRVDIYGQDYDDLCRIVQKVDAAMAVQCENCGDIYVFSSRVTRGEEDGFDLTLSVHRKTRQVVISYWR